MCDIKEIGWMVGEVRSKEGEFPPLGLEIMEVEENLDGNFLFYFFLGIN